MAELLSSIWAVILDIATAIGLVMIAVAFGAGVIAIIGIVLEVREKRRHHKAQTRALEAAGFRFRKEEVDSIDMVPPLSCPHHPHGDNVLTKRESEDVFRGVMGDEW
jgi:hypothetical protein